MIRMIQEADIPRILEIYNWYIANSMATFEIDALSLEEFTNRVHGITERYPWIVLEEEGKIVGYAYLSAFNPRKAYAWTCDLAIYLDHEVRGKGYGTLLMQAMIDLAKKDGYVKMVSLVTTGNTASEKLHEKLGFRNVGTLENTGLKHGKWLGVSFFLKDLNQPDEQASAPMNLPIV